MIALSSSHTAEFAAASDKFRAEEAHARRRVLSESFNRAAQSLEDATKSARTMAESLERKGLLLRAPSIR